MATVEMTTLPATIDDGFDLAPAETTRVVGQFLKYVKGGWFISNETTRLNGTKLVAYEYAPCSQKWFDRRIVASIFPEPGKPFPLTAAACDVADVGHGTVPYDDGPGEWQEGRYLYLAHREDGRDFTYGTGTAGGIQAIDSLAQQIRRVRSRGKPGALPVVELDTTSYFHKKHGTMVDKPLLHVRQWVDEHGMPYPMTPAAANQLAGRIPGSDIRTPVNDLDDDIPF
jgi:hypothetical protein